MRIEVGGYLNSAKETVGKHRIGLGYSTAAVLVIAGTAGMIVGGIDAFHPKEANKDLQLRYPNLPSQEELDRILKEIDLFNSEVITRAHTELTRGVTTVDLSEIENVQKIEATIALSNSLKEESLSFAAEKNKLLQATAQKMVFELLGGTLAFFAGLVVGMKTNDIANARKKIALANPPKTTF